MKHSNAGFTLMELIITITVIVMLVALALPNMQTLLNRNRLIGKTNDIVTAINLARSEAVTRGTAAGACPSADGFACAAGTWNQGWIVWVDGDGNGAFNPGEEVQVNNTGTSGTAAELVTTVASGNINGGVVFTPLGMTTLGAPATITITHANAQQARMINLSPFGQLTTVCVGAVCPQG